MGQVKTDNISLQFAVESAVIGVLPGSPVWFVVEPNDIGDFGATITTTERAPITANRQRRKGTVTDQDSKAGWSQDLTRDIFIQLSEGFVFATYQGNQINRPTAISATAFTVPAGPVLAQHQLIYARGNANSANNGLKEVTTGATSTSIPITGGGMTVETPPTNSLIEVAGWRFATSDLAITVSGTTATITSAAVNLTTIGLHVGQLIHVGGLTAGTQFSAGKGYARVRTIASGTATADKLTSTLATDPGTGDTVDLLFGLFLSNVAVSSGSFLTRSYTVELGYPNLNVEISPADAYEYAVGNLADSMSLKLPLASKAGMEFTFVGTNTGVPTTTRGTNAATPIQPLQTVAYNTSADILRLRVQLTDETGLTTCFKDATLKLSNGVTPEKCLGTLGATFMNVNLFLVDLDAEILFTSIAVASAVRNNTTVTMDTLLKNDDGAISLDIPSMTLGDGKKSFPVHESVRMKLAGKAFQDSFFGYSVGISLFPVVP